MSKNKTHNDYGDSLEIEIQDEATSNAEEIPELDSPDVTQLEQEDNDLQQSNNDLEDMLKRKVAEFENYKRRTDKEKIELLEYGNIRLLQKFVDILDDIRNAYDAAQKTNDNSAVVKGFEMVLQKTEKLFADEGVKVMPIKIGDEFDVNMQEALMHQPSKDVPEGHITMIMQNGYTYKDKVLRYAKVATSAGK
jgi:molecular chaperone GrpE